MRTGSGKEENQIPIINAINKQPVRLDVALPKAAIITGQCMIHVLRRKRFLPGKRIHNLIQKIKVIASSGGKFQIPFETV